MNDGVRYPKLQHAIPEGLTFDDVLLVPGRSEILPARLVASPSASLGNFCCCRQVKSFASRRRAPPNLVEEILKKNHVGLCLLLLRTLGRHERGDAFAVRREIVSRV